MTEESTIINPKRYKKTKTHTDTGGRVCTVCGVYKSWEEYGSHRGNHRNRTTACRDCRNFRSWRDNRERAWKRLGIKRRGQPFRFADFDEIFAAQSGQCALKGCGRELGGRFQRTHVDHDHETGEVRGLLCGRHNRQAGTLAEALAMVEYLRMSTPDPQPGQRNCT